MSETSFPLRPGYSISRVIRGGWQLAGGHGAIDKAQAIDDLIAAFDAGLTTYDCADIYTGVEELIGAARQRLANERGADAAARMKVHTKLVPDLEVLPKISRQYIRGIVETSLRRLGAERLDLVQFHWWDYSQPAYVDAMGWLNEMHLEGRIVDKDIQASEFLDRLFDRRLAEVPLADIPAQDNAAPPFLFHGLPSIRRILVFLQIDDRHVGALACEKHGHRPAYAGIPAGDQRYLVLQLAGAFPVRRVIERLRLDAGFFAGLGMMLPGKRRRRIFAGACLHGLIRFLGGLAGPIVRIDLRLDFPLLFRCRVSRLRRLDHHVVLFANRDKASRPRTVSRIKQTGALLVPFFTRKANKVVGRRNPEAMTTL